MRLTDLDATFLKRLSDSEYQMVKSLADADGVQFQCPKCAQGREERDEEGNATAGTRRWVRISSVEINGGLDAWIVNCQRIAEEDARRFNDLFKSCR